MGMRRLTKNGLGAGDGVGLGGRRSLRPGFDWGERTAVLEDVDSYFYLHFLLFSAMLHLL